MKQRLLSVALILAVTILLIPQTVITAGASTNSDIKTVEKICEDYEWEYLKLANMERTSRGLAPFSTFDKLQQAASVRVDEIAKSYSHTRPDGRSWDTLLYDFDIVYSTFIYSMVNYLYRPANALNSFIHDTESAKQLFSDDYNHLAAGYKSSGGRWVHLLMGKCTYSKLEIGSFSETKQFTQGSSIEDLNLAVILTCLHGESYMPLTSEMCSGFKPDSRTEQTVTVKHGNLSHKFSITLTNPPTPENVRARAASSTKITVRWNRVSGADGYEIYVATSQNGQYRRVKSITDKNILSFSSDSNLHPGRTYYFKVRAYSLVDGKRAYSDFNPVISATTRR